MQKVNISDRDRENDQFYRYKRDRVEVVYEARQGGQTRLANIDNICSQLRASKPVVIKYIQTALATSAIVHDTIRGNITIAQLETILKRYTSKHVLCPQAECRLPEWRNQKCEACGFSHRQEEKQQQSTNKEEEEVDLHNLSEEDYESLVLKGKIYIVSLYDDELLAMRKNSKLRKPNEEECEIYKDYCKFVAQIVLFLHGLYDFRDQLISDKKPLDVVEKLIDEAWCEELTKKDLKSLRNRAIELENCK